MYRTAAVLTLLLTLSACSDSPATSTTGAASATTTISAATTTTPPPDTTVSPTTTATPTTTVAATTTTGASTTTTTWVGEPIDVGPTAGAVLAVVGVAFDDTLNVRAGPGTEHAVAITLEPLFDDIVATGDHWLVPGAIWNQITAKGVTGWANSSFMAYLGSVDDATANIIANGFGGVTPTASTMLELGVLVGEATSGDALGSRVVVSVAPTTGDLGEITVDVIGLEDDALFGVRLHIFGQSDGDGFSLKTIERQLLCGRGVTADGVCI